jgi:acyl carrier protein
LNTLLEVADMIRAVLDDYDLGDTEITRDTSFQRDLQFESIDIVVLGSRLGARYGTVINFARFLSELELDQIISLTVGDIIDYVESCREGR